jgi:hypothetical protein
MEQKMSNIEELEETKEKESFLHKQMMDARFDFAGAVVAAHASWNNFGEDNPIVQELFEKADELEDVYMQAYNELMMFYSEDNLEMAECMGSA